MMFLYVYSFLSYVVTCAEHDKRLLVADDTAQAILHLQSQFQQLELKNSLLESKLTYVTNQLNAGMCIVLLSTLHIYV